MNKNNYYDTSTMLVTSIEILVLGVIFLAIPGALEPYRHIGNFARFFDRELFGVAMFFLGIWGILLSHGSNKATGKYWLQPADVCLILMNAVIVVMFFVSLNGLIETRNAHYIMPTLYFSSISIRIWFGLYALCNQELEYEVVYEKVYDRIKQEIVARRKEVDRAEPK